MGNSNKSDAYPGEFPQSLENNNIKYSGIAVQGMERNKIDQEIVENLINCSSTSYGIQCVKNENIRIIFKCNKTGVPVEVTSVWKIE